MVTALAFGPGAVHALVMPAADGAAAIQNHAAAQDHASHCHDDGANKVSPQPVGHKGCCDCGLACGMAVTAAPAAITAPLPPQSLRLSLDGAEGLSGGTASPPFRPPRA